MLTLFAQAAAVPTAPAAPGILHSGALGLMIDGGLFMWPILFMAILGTAVVIERFRTLKMISGDTSELRGRVADLVRADRVNEAIDLCSAAQGPVPAILLVGLNRYQLIRNLNCAPAMVEEQVTKAMEDYVVHVTAALEQHMPILATISNVAPMVGSVGTVVGMVVLFQDLVDKVGTVNIVVAAAAGIKVKLLVTVWGLIVGIPAYIFYNYFNTVIGRYLLDVEEASSQLIEAVVVRLASQESSGSTDGKSVMRMTSNM